jgi:hypothetical protein
MISSENRYPLFRIMLYQTSMPFAKKEGRPEAALNDF